MTELDQFENLCNDIQNIIYILNDDGIATSFWTEETTKRISIDVNFKKGDVNLFLKQFESYEEFVERCREMCVSIDYSLRAYELPAFEGARKVINIIGPRPGLSSVAKNMKKISENYQPKSEFESVCDEIENIIYIILDEGFHISHMLGNPPGNKNKKIYKFWFCEAKKEIQIPVNHGTINSDRFLENEQVEEFLERCYTVCDNFGFTIRFAKFTTSTIIVLKKQEKPNESSNI